MKELATRAKNAIAMWPPTDMTQYIAGAELYERHPTMAPRRHLIISFEDALRVTEDAHDREYHFNNALNQLRWGDSEAADMWRAACFCLGLSLLMLAIYLGPPQEDKWVTYAVTAPIVVMWAVCIIVWAKSRKKYLECLNILSEMRFVHYGYDYA